MMIGDGLRLDGDQVQCTDCDTTLGDVEENLKYNLVVRENSMENAGPVYVDTERFVSEEMVFREYFCPNCAHLIFTESAKKGDAPLDEFEIA